MNLFITGATGFVGRNLLLKALADGVYSSIIASVRNPEKLKQQLDQEGVNQKNVIAIPWGEALPVGLHVDHAVHCAGVLFARDRDAYFSVNVEQSMRVIQSLPPDAKVLALSSQSAGGPTPNTRDFRTMDDVDMPLTWYGESKLAMEQKLKAERPGSIIIRPPMILGARDQATLPLFKMAAGLIRPKPGLREKSYSWIAVRDLVRDIFSLLRDVSDWQSVTPRTMYASAPQSISDRDLVRTAALLMKSRGIDLPLPHPLLGLVAQLVDAVPTLRENTPSLTRDRVKEIFADRWVVDAEPFRNLAGQHAYASLHETLAETLDWYRKCGQLR